MNQGFTLDTRISTVPQSPDCVYLDIQTTNILGNSTQPIPINFSENRTNAILDNAGEYCMSVVRFSLDTQTLPVFIPTIQGTSTGNTDPNKTVYYVGMTNGSSSVSYPIEWIPQNQYLSAPSVGQQPIETSMNNLYYYCYDYSWLAYLVQNAMTQCFNALGLTGTPPTFVYDPSSQKFIVSANKALFQYTSPSSPPQCGLYFNSDLYDLFSTFSFINTGLSSDNLHYMLVFNSSNGANDIIMNTTDDNPDNNEVFIQTIQELPTLSNITPISSIVFTSSMLPVEPEQISSPQLYLEGTHLTSGNNANIGAIITDLESDDGVYKPSLSYVPTAEYRRLSMLSSRELTHIQLSVYWKNRFGQLFPVTLGGGASMTCKILFQKRSSIYNNV